jgi:primosomal protein N' (replication factor Y)
VNSPNGRREVNVAVPVAVDRGFTYSVPDGWSGAPQPGTRVLVSFGSRVLLGVVRPAEASELNIVPKSSAGPKASRVKPLLESIDAADQPALSEDLVALCEWMQDYYLAPVGEVYRLALPGLLTNADARQASLTEIGRRWVEGGPLLAGGSGEPPDSAELELLRALAGREWTSLAKLRKRKPPITGMFSRVEEMARRGWIECRWDSEGERSARTEMHLRRTDYLRGAQGDEAALKKAVGRSKQRRALLDALELHHSHEAEGGRGDSSWLPLSELRASFPRVRSLLTPLVDAGLVVTEERLRALDDFSGEIQARDEAREPTPDQGIALEALRSSLDEGAFSCSLLQGITGSGKTEVYLQLIARAREQGGGAIVLVPEISLTPQLADRFRARFGDSVAVLHSGLSPRQRVDAWEHIRRGERPIVIGARSAIFAPVPRLRVIVVDEEHDTSFKQEEGVRYHARDVALMRARTLSAVVVLGSATPALESYENARRGRYRWLRLRSRPSKRPLPKVVMLPLSVHRADPETMLTARLLKAIGEAVSAGGQVILFLNRRGYTTAITCKACGAFQQCPDCSSPSMTYHLRRNRLLCHLCGHIEEAPRNCLSCGSGDLVHGKAGTERVELAIEAALPQLRVSRLDRDTSRGRRLADTLSEFRAGRSDVLIGTQMLSKGHDFPGVTLVGVLQGDHGLAIPDLRSGERTFQLLTQVAGRAGRGDLPGQVLVQAWKVDHPALRHASQHDYPAFAEEELEARRSLGNPVRARSDELAQAVQSCVSRMAEADPKARVRVLGPVASPIERINRRVRWQILLRANSRGPLRWMLRALRPVLGASGSGPRQTQARVDVDPQTLL